MAGSVTQKIISSGNIRQGSVIIRCTPMGIHEQNITRDFINSVEISPGSGVNAKYTDRLCFYNALINESGAHRSFPAS